MTVYVVPCGVSIIDGLTRGRHGHADPQDLLAQATEFGRRLHADRIPTPTVVHEWWQTIAEAADDTDVSTWSPVVAAETATLAGRDKADIDRLLATTPQAHRVVLLASDTPQGLTAALLVATRLARPTNDGELHRIHYAETHRSTLTGGLPAGTVTVVRVRGLAADAPDGLRTGSAGLGGTLRAALDTSNGEPVEVHLTGGFKATLLHLLSLAELAHSINGKLTAWYLPDDLPGRPRSVPIGLRRFSPGYLDWVRDEVTTVARGGRPPIHEVTAHGAAWDDTTGTPRLNGFGEAYLALLGSAPVARSDEGG
ncbi:hypothetical protein AWW66_26600 [Micromonospora rosaria]|uniref:CRISPR-associated protein n=1 Tax=Micromonospora rosaria TaxID=47874 RepID=A0A136PKV1_9ACTN|nr:hypothetical protein [Micromonospora rosaria]KXK59003.1 hypothetical protein AWW66_26600 [Micromonospora rosaria]